MFPSVITWQQHLQVGLLLSSLLFSSSTGLKFAAISGRSPFFYPVEEGWNDTCRLLELDCTYIIPNWDNYTVRDAVYDLAYNQNYDGIALAPAGKYYMHALAKIGSRSKTLYDGISDMVDLSDYRHFSHSHIPPCFSL